MTVHIQKMTSEVTAYDGDLPLSEKQIESLAKIIMKRMQEKQEEGGRIQEAIALKAEAAPSYPTGKG